MSGKWRQLIGVIFVLLLVAVATSWAFRAAHPGWILYREAQAAAAGGNRAQAIEKLRAAIAAGLSTNASTRELGEWLLAENQLGEARQLFETLHREYPNDLAAVKVLAGLYDRDRQVDRAIALYSEPQIQLDAEGRLHFAELLRQAKRYTEAEKLYREILNADAGQKKARLHLAEMLAWQGNYAPAEAEFQQLLEQYPNDREVLIGLARLLSWKGDFEASIETYRRVVQ